MAILMSNNTTQHNTTRWRSMNYFAEADKADVQKRNEEAKKGYEEAADSFKQALEDAKHDREERRRAMNASDEAKKPRVEAVENRYGVGKRQVGGEHYISMPVQPWDAMEAWLTPEAFRGFLLGNAIKCLARADKKGGVEDLRKAAHYIEKLIATTVQV